MQPDSTRDTQDTPQHGEPSTDNLSSCNTQPRGAGDTSSQPHDVSMKGAWKQAETSQQPHVTPTTRAATPPPKSP